MIDPYEIKINIIIFQANLLRKKREKKETCFVLLYVRFSLKCGIGCLVTDTAALLLRVL